MSELLVPWFLEIRYIYIGTSQLLSLDYQGPLGKKPSQAQWFGFQEGHGQNGIFTNPADHKVILKLYRLDVPS